MPTRSTAWPAGAPCWVDCQVDDVPAAAAFYGELFGWQCVTGPPEIPGYVLAHRDGHRVAGISGKPADTPQPSVWSTYFATDHVDTSVAGAVAAGGTVMTAPQDVAALGRMSFGTDAAGAPYGLWQSGTHTGMQLFNEPGALCWNELHTREHDAARDFYAQVFGWTYSTHEPAHEATYSFVRTPGTAEPVGGIHLDALLAEGDRSHWLVWFGVHRLDERLAAAQRLGATVLAQPFPTPYGRSAVVRAVQGELFGLMELRDLSHPRPR